MKSREIIRRAWRETLTDWHVECRAARRRSWLRQVVTTTLALLRIAVAALTLGPAPQPPGQPASGRRSWTDTMITDLRIVARSLRRSPWFTTTAGATVALSMVLASTTFAVVDGVLFKPLPYSEVHRLFAVFGAMSEEGTGRLAFLRPDFNLWRAVSGAQFAAFQRIPDAGSLGASNRTLTMAGVDLNFFDVLGQQPMMGGFRPEHFEAAPGGPRGVLLSYRLWRAAFGGDRAVLGQTIASALPFPLFVAGVLPPDFVFPTVNARDLPDAILPLIVDAAGNPTFGNAGLFAIARLDPGVEAAAVRQALHAVAQAHRADTLRLDGKPAGFQRVTFEPIESILGLAERRGFRLALSAALALVLLACVNVAGLMAARGRERTREIGVRVALGAGSRDVLRLLVLESVLIGILGGAVGASLAWPTLAGVSSLLPPLSYLKTPAIDTRVVIFALLASTFSVVTMTMPAMAASMRRDLRDRLAGSSGSTARSRTAGRFMLIATQASLGMVLVLGGALLLASFINLAREDPGFELDRTARVTVVSPRLGELLTEVRRTPGVVAAAGINASFMQGGFFQTGAYEIPRIEGLDFNSASVTADYFTTLGLRVIEGRLPTQAEIEAAQPLVVVSQLFAERVWPGERVVGKVLRRSSRASAGVRDATIVGVVSDAKLQKLDERPYGDFYLPFPEPSRSEKFTVLLRTSGDPGFVAGTVARRLRGWDSRVSVTAAESLRTSIWGSVKPRTFNAVLYGSLAAAALLLVAIGIAGLVATAVARRQREIGIRMALGADRHRVRRLVVIETVRPVIAGLAIGAVASSWTAELVKANLYNTTPYDWTVWTATVVTVLAAATIAGYIPARRASQVNPISVLRVE